jgi:hypothetical protein
MSVEKNISQSDQALQLKKRWTTPIVHILDLNAARVAGGATRTSDATYHHS